MRDRISASLSGVIFFGFIASLLLGNLFKPYLFSPEVHFGFLDMTVFITILTAIFFHRQKFVTRIKSHINIFRAVVSFAGIGIFSLLISLFNFQLEYVLIGSLYLIRFLAYVSLLFTLPVIFTSDQLRYLKYVAIFTLIITGYLQYTFFPDIRFLKVSDWDPHYFRVVGTLLDPGFFSIILCIILFQIWNRPIFSSKNLNLAVWLVIYVLFALTYSRSGYLAFISGWGYIALKTRDVKRIIYPLALIILTILVLPRGPGGEGVKLERTSSIQARIINWQNSLSVFIDHPVAGVGFNTYRYAQRQYGFLDNSDWLRSHAGAGADSSLLFIAATTGILGLIAFGYLARQYWLESRGVLYMQAGLIALAVHSVFLNSLFYPFILFWISLSLCERKLTADKRQ